VTALGGRPHAEPLALLEAGSLAKGATAYVTLEPCAHHGRTPPCARTLIDAGIARVVTAVVDPDDRVNERGHAMLRAAGIEVVTGCLSSAAALDLSAYLNRKLNNRAQVTLKLAVSADGFLGIKGNGNLARSQTHLMRSMHQAILVGAGTLAEDDPDLTCRLQGLEQRSPIRIALDPNGRMSLDAKIFKTARTVRTLITAPATMDTTRLEALTRLGVGTLNCEMILGRIALPELLEDLASIGINSVMVEGGAALAQSLLNEKLVDEIVLFEGSSNIQSEGYEMIPSPIREGFIPDGFVSYETLQLGEDKMTRYTKSDIKTHIVETR
jgi:diaminohydroxyphosphoribosylaminopyrimidine deaminase/5-amino-6-(5-phosphoribosylamino)uracil reductase